MATPDHQALQRRRWRRPFSLFLCLLALALLAGCTGSGQQVGLNISGSTSVSPFVEHLAEIYQRQHPGAKIFVDYVLSAEGQQELANLGLIKVAQ